MIVPFPEELYKATEISWTMEHGHNVVTSPFSGYSQGQRSQLERWSFTMTFRPLKRREAQILMGFFLQLEGNLNMFTFSDPAACEPLGHALGSPYVVSYLDPMLSWVSTAGWQPSVTNQLMAGDWVQIGNQLCRVRQTVDSNEEGLANINIWPKMMASVEAETPLVLRKATGIFRYTSEFPSWSITAGTTRGYKIAMSGVQEVLPIYDL